MCAAAAVKAEDNEEAELWGGGEYHCMAAYPSPSCSMQLGRQNLHLFRLKNTRFDVIGGIFYFCLVVRAAGLMHASQTVMPGCDAKGFLPECDKGIPVCRQGRFSTSVWHQSRLQGAQPVLRCWFLHGMQSGIVCTPHTVANGAETTALCGSWTCVMSISNEVGAGATNQPYISSIAVVLV